jgi:hypothetical protein
MRPRLRLGRVLAVYLVAGVALGVVSGVLSGLGVPMAVRVALVTGALVLTTPMLSRLVRTGRAPWLVRDER